MPPAPIREITAHQEKVASVNIRMAEPPKELDGHDPDIKVARLLGQKDRLERQVKQAQQEQRQARNGFLLALGQLGEYFKQAEYNRLPPQWRNSSNKP